MDRIFWTSPLLLPNEQTVVTENNVRLYDGDQKVYKKYKVSTLEHINSRNYILDII